MDAPVIGAMGVIALFVMLFLRVPVWASLTIVGVFGSVAVAGWQSALAMAGTTPFDSASAYTLSVIPLFVLMGDVASGTRLSAELFAAARVMLGGHSRWPVAGFDPGFGMLRCGLRIVRRNGRDHLTHRAAGDA